MDSSADNTIPKEPEQYTLEDNSTLRDIEETISEVQIFEENGIEADAEDTAADEEIFQDNETETDVEDTIEEEEMMNQEYTADEELELLRQDLEENLDGLIERLTKQSEEHEPLVDVEPSTSDDQVSELTKFYLERLAKNNASTKEKDSEEDTEYLSPTKRARCIGDNYQAQVLVSPVASSGSDSSEHPNDVLMWKPSSKITDEQINEYLKKAYSILKQKYQSDENSSSSTKTYDQSAYHDLALRVLMENEYDVFDSVVKLALPMGKNVPNTPKTNGNRSDGSVESEGDEQPPKKKN